MRTTIRVLVAMGMSVAVWCATMIVASAQPPSPQPAAPTAAMSPEQRIYDRYLRWFAALPMDERTPDVLDRYKAILAADEVAPAEVQRQIGIIKAQQQASEADRWNRYFTEERPRFNTMPNAFLVQIADGRTPGTALDVGMGQGRNSLWLARQGWDVMGFDPADKAIAVAQKNAETIGVRLKTVVATDESFDWGESRWDLILLSYEGCGQMAPKVQRALKPGGIVIVESFHEDAVKGHRIAGSICRPGELPQLFKDLRVLHYSEPIAMPDFGNERMRIVRFAAEKPATP